MRKSIIIISLVGAGLLILDSLNAANAVLLFVFAGVIPGTNLLISPVDMMAATATAMTVIILRLTVWPRVRSYIVSPSVEQTRSKKATRHTI